MHSEYWKWEANEWLGYKQFDDGRSSPRRPIEAGKPSERSKECEVDHDVMIGHETQLKSASVLRKIKRQAAVIGD